MDGWITRLLIMCGFWTDIPYSNAWMHYLVLEEKKFNMSVVVLMLLEPLGKQVYRQEMV